MRSLVFLFALALSQTVLATQDQIFGMGGLASGRVSTLPSDPDNPFSALSNPALLPMGTTPRFSFATSFVGSSRDPLKNVSLDSPEFRTSTGRAQSGDYQFQDAAASLWVTSFQYPFNLPRWASRRAGIGIVASGPFGHLRNFRSSTPYDFSVLRYGTSDSQFKGTISTGFEIIPDKLTFGLGLSMFITASGDADAYLVSDNPSGRLNLDVGLNTSMVSGLTYKYDDGDAVHLFSLTYHQAAAPKLIQQFVGNVDLGVGRGTATVPATLETYLYYEPETWETEWQGNYEGTKVSLGFSYQRWSDYRASYLVVQTVNADNSRTVSQTPSNQLRDTLNPRASVEIPLYKESWRLGTGYQYRPSPVKDLSQSTNLLDSDTHVFGASVRYHFKGNDWFPLPLNLSLHGQYHHFATRDVQKASSQYVGSPGFKYAGNAYNIGVLMDTTF